METNWIYASPIIDNNGTIYIGTNMGLLYAVSPQGAMQWVKTLGGEITSTPALGSNDFIYVGVSYGVNDDVLGAVYALSILGDVMWDGRVVVDGRLPSSPALYGNRLYIGTERGTLYGLVGAVLGPFVFHAAHCVVSVILYHIQMNISLSSLNNFSYLKKNTIIII